LLLLLPPIVVQMFLYRHGGKLLYMLSSLVMLYRMPAQQLLMQEAAHAYLPA
jgi:hypothetical protein